MKHFYTLCLLFGLGSGFAQSYIPMVVEGNYWKLLAYNAWTSQNEINECYIKGDSLLNSFIYKKAYICTPNGKMLAGLLREDSIAKKIYGYQFFSINLQMDDAWTGCPLSQEEVVFHDFSVEKGDTILACGLANTINTKSLVRKPFAGNLKAIFQK